MNSLHSIFSRHPLDLQNFPYLDIKLNASLHNFGVPYAFFFNSGTMLYKLHEKSSGFLAVIHFYSEERRSRIWLLNLAEVEKYVTM